MEDRRHLPPPPLGYRWEFTVNKEDSWVMIALVPNAWEHLNPGQGQGASFGYHAEEGMEAAYERAVHCAWIRVDVDRQVEELRRSLREPRKR